VLPHLDANQLKLFQQLTQTVNPEVATPPIQSFPPPPPTASSENDIVAGSSTYWNKPRNAPDKPWDSGQVGSSYQASPSVEENNYHGHRGRFRGGYRSRVRGRYGDRDREDYRDRFHDAARSPPAGLGRQSRSRSPPRSRYGGGAGRRDVKPYSPPHRPSIVGQPDRDADASSSQQPGVDEFGREIRPSSDDDGRSETPDDLKSRPAPPPPDALAHAHLSPTSAPAVEGAPQVSGEQENSAVATPQAASATGDSEMLHQDTGEVGLQSFDYSSFDPTLPSSWEALGKAWAATNGRQPLQEELMMFVMEFTVSMANQVPAAPSVPVATQANQWTGQRWTGDPRGAPPRGGRNRSAAFGFRGGGRRGFNAGGGTGQTRWDYGGEGYADANETDAIVLGEHTNTNNDVHSGSGWTQDAHEQAQEAGPGEEGDGQMGSPGAAGTGGRMQKVGDKWVFVRNDGSS
jgi:protein NRD1